MDLIQKKEAEKFADEIFEGLKKNLEASKSDTEAKKEIVKSCKELFSTAKFKKVDKKDISLFPLFGGMEYKLGCGGGDNLVQFRDDSGWRGLPIIIAKKDGKIKIVSFKWADY